MGFELSEHGARRASFQTDEVSCDTSLREHRKNAVGSFRAGTCEFTSPSFPKKTVACLLNRFLKSWISDQP